MGIVRGADGRLYNIPDNELDRYVVPEEAKAQEAPAPKATAPRPRPRHGPVVIQIFTRAPVGDPDVTAQSAWGGWGQTQRAHSGGFQQFVIWP